MSSKNFSILLGTFMQVVAFGQPVEVSVDVSKNGDLIRPIWGTMNTFVPSRFLGTENRPAMWFKDGYPYVDNIILMTAIGGRINHPELEFYDEDSGGNPRYDFTVLKRILDNVLHAGLRPIIVLSSVPRKMVRQPPRVGIYLTTADPPVDYDRWYQYIRNIALFCIENYGKERVLQWEWRVGTEPDNKAWWLGSKEDYFKLYDYTVAAITDVLPTARIGPGNILPQVYGSWGLEILDHCLIGANYFSKHIGTKICFLTFSAYGKVGDPNPMAQFEDDVSRIRNRLAHLGKGWSIDIGIDEGNLLYDENHVRLWRHDVTEYGASWQGLYLIMSIKNGLSRIVQWGSRTDGNDLLYTNGLKTPTYNVKELFQKVSWNRSLNVQIDCRSSLAAKGIAVEALGSIDSLRRTVSVIIVHHPRARGDSTRSLVNVKLRQLPHPSNTPVAVRHWIVNRERANFSSIWLNESRNIPRFPSSAGAEIGGGSIYDGAIERLLDEAGRDFWNSRQAVYDRLDDLDTIGVASPVFVDSNGEIKIELRVEGHHVSLLELQFDTVSAVRQQNSVGPLARFELKQNFPNPFNATTVLPYEVKEAGYLTIKVYDVLGRVVDVPTAHTFHPTGSYSICWPQRGTEEACVPSGIYFYRLLGHEASQTRVMVLAK